MNLPINKELPHLDNIKVYKTEEEVVRRALCIYATLAISFGLEKVRGLNWLKEEGLIDSLTDQEKEMALHNKFEGFEIKVEALWALAWALNLLKKIDYTCVCDDNLSSFFPKISQEEKTNNFKTKVKLRDLKELVVEADLVYCIHWGMVENSLRGKKNEIPLYVIEERRRAIDWILYYESWEDVDLDT